MQAMRTPQVPSGSLGLTWSLDRGIVEHGGGTFGQVAWLRLVPERDFAFVGMANFVNIANITDVQEGLSVFQPISQWAFESFGIDTPEPAPLPRTAEQLESYAGTYDSEMFQVAVTTEGRPDRLSLSVRSKWPGQSSAPPEQLQTAFVAEYDGESEIMVVEGRLRGARAQFVMEGGEVRWLRWNRRLARRVG
jgi:hypothetical protein